MVNDVGKSERNKLELIAHLLRLSFALIYITYHRVEKTPV
jgi:hypothetical protein